MSYIHETHYDIANSWALDSRRLKGSLQIKLANGKQHTLTAGQRIQLDGGQLEVVAVRLWMGYSIFYNPWLPWFFAVSIVGVFGLAWHFYVKLGAHSKHPSQVKQSVRGGYDVPTI